MTRERKLLALLLAASLLAMACLCPACLAHEIHHHCLGEGCPVCAFIAQARGFIALLLLYVFLAIRILTRRARLVGAALPIPFFLFTPIGRKSRMNN